MERIKIGPFSQARGVVKVPGSKSLSNRALLLAALCDSTTHISNLLVSRDTECMVNALGALGVGVSSTHELSTIAQGGQWDLSTEAAPVKLHLGNAGTAFRPLAAVLSFTTGEFELSGDPRMHERPIADLVDALRLLGADIRYLANNGYPPIHISGKAIEGGHTVISGNVSSQFLTAVLLAAPLAAGDVTIDVTGELVSKPYIDMTIETMARFGVSVVREGYRRFLVPAAARYISPGTYAVEPDASSATYFLAAGAIAGEVTVEGLGSKCIQGDAAFAQVLHAMGADVEIAETHTTVRSCPLTAIDMDLNHIPDAAMTAAVAALFARGTTRIRNIYNWRVKETDRLDAMDRELSKLGATVRTTRDSIEITPPTKFLPAVIDTYDDHRMAMSLALAAFGVGLTINDPQCTDKTFPQFFDRFNAICS